MTHIVLLAHGSSDARSIAGAERLRDQVRRHLSTARPHDHVSIAYLDNAEPRLHVVVHEHPDHDVVVVPLFLARAFHLSVDVPAAIAQVDGTFTVRETEHLGLDMRFLDALNAQLPAGAAVVMASAGTSDTTAQHAFVEFAQAWSARRGTPVTAAYATQAEPSVATAFADAGSDAAVAMLLIFDGVIPDRIRAVAGDSPCTTTLVDTPALLEVVLERISSPG